MRWKIYDGRDKSLQTQSHSSIQAKLNQTDSYCMIDEFGTKLSFLDA